MRNAKKGLVILGVVLFLAAGVASSGMALPDHLNNPDFNSTKTPAPTEPPLNLPSTLLADWNRLVTKKKPPRSCKSHEIWKSTPQSSIVVTATKNLKAPVVGKFNRFTVYFYVHKKSLLAAGEGDIDLSSYDSGVEVRDSRVQRYVLGVEKPKAAFAHFTFLLDKKEKDTFLSSSSVETRPSESIAKVELKMNDHNFRWIVPVKAEKKRASLHLTSVKSARFSYVTDETPQTKAGLVSMMRECNHEFLSTYVDVGLDLTLDPVCKQ